MYQNHDASIDVQWLINGTSLRPSSGDTITLKNLIPYWRSASSATLTSLWGNIIWSDRPWMSTPMTIDAPFRYIQFRFTNDGSNATDEIAYAGIEIVYQTHTVLSRPQN